MALWWRQVILGVVIKIWSTRSGEGRLYSKNCFHPKSPNSNQTNQTKISQSYLPFNLKLFVQTQLFKFAFCFTSLLLARMYFRWRQFLKTLRNLFCLAFDPSIKPLVRGQLTNELWSLKTQCENWLYARWGVGGVKWGELNKSPSTRI